MGYVIKYTDGAYNQGSGFPCRLEEATVYGSMTEAEAKAGDLADVDGVVPFDVAQLSEKGAVVSFAELADAIEAATIEIEVCSPSNDYYSAHRTGTRRRSRSSTPPSCWRRCEADMDFIIEHSPMQGGWCVYEQVAYADYNVVRGPFPYQDQAEAALEELTDEQ